VVFPLLWVYLKPEIIADGWFSWISNFWIPSVFWGCALIIFIIILLILWGVLCCIRKKRDDATEDRNNTNSNLDSFTIHSEANKNIKDRFEMKDMFMGPRNSDTGDYRDIQDIFRQRNNFKPKFNAAPQTTSERLSPLQDDNIFKDMTIRSGSLRSCERCSELITDEEMVNIFLNKKTNKDTDEKKRKI